MQADISPCPFCASPNVRVEDCSAAISVACFNCGGIGPAGDNVAEAVALWNSRSTLAASFCHDPSRQIQTAASYLPAPDAAHGISFEPTSCGDTP